MSLISRFTSNPKARNSSSIVLANSESLHEYDRNKWAEKLSYDLLILSLQTFVDVFYMVANFFKIVNNDRATGRWIPAAFDCVRLRKQALCIMCPACRSVLH